eukprot:5455750-Pyramimonas_sp.AAC.2
MLGDSECDRDELEDEEEQEEEEEHAEHERGRGGERRTGGEAAAAVHGQKWALALLASSSCSVSIS